MARIAPVTSSNLDPKLLRPLSQVKSGSGTIPNLFSTLANAPVALNGFLSLTKTLSRGRLSVRQREILALAIAQENECQYCLSAHTASSRAAGLSATGALKARGGDSDNPFERARQPSRRTSFVSAVLSQIGILASRGRLGSRTASCWRSWPMSH